MMLGAVAEDQTSVRSEDSVTWRAKFLCSYGGRIMPRPHDNQLRYVGGETRILSVPKAVVFGDLMAKLKNLCSFDNVILKYQLPDEDLDALVSVISDEDLENMMEEYDRVEARDSSSRLRLFLFPILRQDAGADSEHKFVDAINGVYRKTAAQTLAPLLEGQQQQQQQQKKNFVLVQQPVPPSQLPPQVCAATPSVVPHVPVLQPAAPIQTPQVQPPLPVPVVPSVVPNLVAAAAPPQLVHTRLVAAQAPGRAVVSPASGVPHVLAARAVVPQPAFVAPTTATRPVIPASTYVPLVDVSRGVLPKGMVLRHFSVEDDRSESPSSQSSLMNDERRDSGEMNWGGDARRLIDVNEFEKLRIERAQENNNNNNISNNNVILQQLQEAKMLRSNMVLGSGGGETKVEPEALPQMGVGVQLWKGVHEQVDHGLGIHRAASAPLLQTVDVAAVTAAAAAASAQQFQRQFSDRSEPHLAAHHHHQENVLPRCIAGDVLVEVDDRFPSPLPRLLNGVRPQQEHPISHVVVDPPPQLLQKPIKVVPQGVAVNPYNAP